MRKWCQVAGSTHGTLFGNARNNVIFDVPENAFHRFYRHARIAFTKRVKFQYQHQFGNFIINKITHAHAVAHQQVVLQLFGFVLVNQRRAERPKTGVDAVNDFLFTYDVFDHFLIGFYA